MNGDTADLIQRYIYYFGQWEPSLTSILKRHWARNPGSTFIDVGANIGYYSLLAAKQLNRGRVIAIEAHPMIFSALERNLEINKDRQIQTINCAVLGSEGAVEVHLGPKDNCGQTTVLSGRFQSGASVTVRGARLVDIVDAEAIRSCKSIKIDVEGAEKEVVAGLASTLSLFPKDVLFALEITPQWADGAEIEEIFNTFYGAGFSAFTVAPDTHRGNYGRGAVIHTPTPIKGFPSAQADVLFCRPDFVKLD